MQRRKQLTASRESLGNSTLTILSREHRNDRQTSEYILPKHNSHYRQKTVLEYLEAMQEPSIYAKRDSGDSIYRLLWIRWSDVPITCPSRCVRIENNSENGSLNILVKKTSATEDKQPRDFILHKNDVISGEAFDQLNEMHQRMRFWEVSTEEKLPLGGELWIFEALHNGKYHVVVRSALETAVAALKDKEWLSTLRPGVVAIIERDLPLAELAASMLTLGEIEF
jgi:hypothetical protein